MLSISFLKVEFAKLTDQTKIRFTHNFKQYKKFRLSGQHWLEFILNGATKIIHRPFVLIINYPADVLTTIERNFRRAVEFSDLRR